MGGLVLATAALASDGQVELDQLCAVATGCLPGDAPGFPVSLGSGSYVLTSNLTVASENETAIVVLAAGVEIDLKGFEIAGPVGCGLTGSTLTCLPATGSGRGVDAAGRSRVTVRNGSVHGFGERGVYTGDYAQIRDLSVEWNLGNGIEVGTSSLMREVIANQNGGSGIVAADSAVIGTSVAFGNRLDGIQASIGASVVGTAAHANGDDGINTGRDGVVRDSALLENEGNGIEVGSGSVVSDNASSGNGGDGISTGTALDASVQRNTARANADYGLRLGPQATYRENTITTSNGLTVTGGIDLGANFCDGAGSCP